MNNFDADLLFPPRVISLLIEARSATWQELVKGILQSGQDSDETVAFTLMMANLNNCTTCNADSYRAMQGCTKCSRQSLKRYRGSDSDLLALFQKSILEVRKCR